VEGIIIILFTIVLYFYLKNKRNRDTAEPKELSVDELATSILQNKKLLKLSRKANNQEKTEIYSSRIKDLKEELEQNLSSDTVTKNNEHNRLTSLAEGDVQNRKITVEGHELTLKDYSLGIHTWSVRLSESFMLQMWDILPPNSEFIPNNSSNERKVQLYFFAPILSCFCIHALFYLKISKENLKYIIKEIECLISESNLTDKEKQDILNHFHSSFKSLESFVLSKANPVAGQDRHTNKIYDGFLKLIAAEGVTTNEELTIRVLISSICSEVMLKTITNTFNISYS
jgi:hypothetical protein